MIKIPIEGYLLLRRKVEDNYWPYSVAAIVGKDSVPSKKETKTQSLNLFNSYKFVTY